MNYAAAFAPRTIPWSRILGGATALGLLAGPATGFGIAQLIDAPVRQDYVVEAASESPGVVVMDPDDVLDPKAEARLREEAGKIHAADTVRQVNYLVLAKNKDNVNDSVEEFLRAQHPELIGEDAFVDGNLFVGVGLDPRQAFIFAGNDVASEAQLEEDDAHLEESLDAIKPAVKDGDIPAGLLAGTREAVDAAQVSEERFATAQSDRAWAIGGGGATAGLVTAGLVSAVGGARRSRRAGIIQARKDYDYVFGTYAGTAGRLDQIDVRAHSLESGLLDQHLRRQWEEVRGNFLNLHDQLRAHATLPADAPDSEFSTLAPTLAKARTACEKVETAEGNIEQIFQVEKGDAEARRSALSSLRQDLSKARLEVMGKVPELRAEAERLEARAGELAQNPKAPAFMERYLDLLGAVALLSDETRKRLATHNEAADAPARPRIDEPGYYPGVGYHGFVPFMALSNWNAQANTAAVNGGFSSGFAGAGGSSSF